MTDAPPAAALAADGLRVSVVVPTIGRPALLRRCLLALLDQTLPVQAYEIVVADDGRGDTVRRCVEAVPLPAGATLRWLPAGPTRGPAAARNRGWLAARAPVVAFTDDDTVPRADWLAQGLDAMARRCMDGRLPGAVAGAIVMPLPEWPTDYERDAARLSQAEFVTANCLVRRNALFDLGGFDERFAIAWREDSDLQFRLLEAGWCIAPAPLAVVVHPVRPAHWGVSVPQQRKVRYDALLYKKHPRLYRHRIRRGPPWEYLAITAALALAIWGLAKGDALQSAIGVIGWLALTARFCRRRLDGAPVRVAALTEMVVTSVAIPPLALFWRMVGAVQFRVPFM